MAYFSSQRGLQGIFASFAADRAFFKFEPGLRQRVANSLSWTVLLSGKDTVRKNQTLDKDHKRKQVYAKVSNLEPFPLHLACRAQAAQRKASEHMGS